MVREMLRHRHLIVLLAVLLLAGMCLYPPWVSRVITYAGAIPVDPLGYHPIWWQGPPRLNPAIHMRRLLLQAAGVLLLAVAAWPWSRR